MSEETSIVLLGDGDRVGAVLEELLLEGRFRELGCLSRTFARAIADIAARSRESLGAEVVVAGGDDLVLLVPSSRYDRGALQELASWFLDRTGRSISFGAGRTVEEAVLNLRRAKAVGGGRVVDWRTPRRGRRGAAAVRN